jgi:chromosome segregation ATPase
MSRKEMEFIPDALKDAYRKAQLNFSRIMGDIQTGEEKREKLEAELKVLNDEVVSKKIKSAKLQEDAKKKVDAEVAELLRQASEEKEQAVAARQDAARKQKEISDIKKEMESQLFKINQAHAEVDAQEQIRKNGIAILGEIILCIQEKLDKI